MVKGLGGNPPPKAPPQTSDVGLTVELALQGTDPGETYAQNTYSYSMVDDNSSRDSERSLP